MKNEKNVLVTFVTGNLVLVTAKQLQHLLGIKNSRQFVFGYKYF